MTTISQVKQKKKQSEIKLIKLKKTKIQFETSFKPMWHEIRTSSYLNLELVSFTKRLKRVKCSS